ncbi:MAG: polysaccharide pyruvyl transferase family protein [Pseudomonadota bacterium]
MRVTLLNVKYSPNLGDGVIAECLEAGLRKHLPGSVVESCDLAGRRAYGTGLNKSRELVINALSALPKPLRRICTNAILRYMISTRLKTHYEAALVDQDAVVLGGGQLLADADLNFPLKINAALNQARLADAIIVVHGVGVSNYWSDKGRQLFLDVLGENAQHVGVRDERSKAHWLDHFEDAPDAIVGDPGLLAEQVYGPMPRSQSSSPRIGLGVVHPKTIKLHADERGSGATNYSDLFCDVACQIADSGRNVVMFTNGAFDDGVFADRLRRRIEKSLNLNDRISFAPQPKTPRDLVQLIASFDGVIAHRLHANIVAYAYGVPHVGLGWDTKVQSFLASVGRSKFAISAQNQNPDAIMGALEAALSEPISEEARAAIAAECEQDIVRLADKLCSFSRVSA